MKHDNKKEEEEDGAKREWDLEFVTQSSVPTTPQKGRARACESDYRFGTTVSPTMETGEHEFVNQVSFGTTVFNDNHPMETTDSSL